MSELPRDSDGKLSAYAWPGGYPIFYLDAGDNVLCPACANKDAQGGALIQAADVNWEDPNLYCDDCSERIESAYTEED